MLDFPLKPNHQPLLQEVLLILFPFLAQFHRLPKIIYQLRYLLFGHPSCWHFAYDFVFEVLVLFYVLIEYLRAF